MFYLALRNFVQNKVRLAVATGGVALALTVILAFDAIFTGVAGQLSAYIDHSRADVWVAQAGVRNLHMSASWLPAATVDEVRRVPGVASATPILYVTDMVIARGTRNLAYIIGLPPHARAGTPWQLSAGVGLPGPGQAIIDRPVARQSGIGVGDTVTILGRRFRVAGLALGTASLTNSVAFISLRDFARVRGSAAVVSFVLARVASGVTAEAVAARIAARVPGVSVQTRAAFAAQERQLVMDMGADVITIMNLAGLLIGLAVMALTVYTAILARRAEYGVLKALGARNGHLYRAVIAQAYISVTVGFALALAITLLLAAALPATGAALALQVSAASLLKVAVLALLIAGVAALLPIRQLARLDPASVFRGGLE